MTSGPVLTICLSLMSCPARLHRRGRIAAQAAVGLTWRQLSGLLKRVAEGQQDPAEVVTSLRIVLQLVLGLTLILYLVIMPCRDALPRFR
jgi:hypothetical protein